MAFPIEDKLVIAVASSALFNLSESDSIFRQYGIEKYQKHQEENINKVFDKGVAFPFLKRLLSLNDAFPNEQPIEVVLLSRNSPETGRRVFRSISEHGLNITRAAFFSGETPYNYLPAFNASLFLSANEQDVKDAIDSGYAAGQVLESDIVDDDNDKELRLAFDFDGVIADDESEKIYKERGIKMYQEYEKIHANEPLNIGPIGGLLKKISIFQSLEKQRKAVEPLYNRILKISIVTARNAPAHERVITTLNDWNVDVDEAFFMGGVDKYRVLNIMHPHIFFDDQKIHLKDLTNIPAVHIPFGIANNQ